YLPSFARGVRQGGGRPAAPGADGADAGTGVRVPGPRGVRPSRQLSGRLVEVVLTPAPGGLVAPCRRDVCRGGEGRAGPLGTFSPMADRSSRGEPAQDSGPGSRLGPGSGSDRL